MLLTYPEKVQCQVALYPMQVLGLYPSKGQSWGMPNRIAHFRKKVGMSQEALGKALHSGRSTVAKLEGGDIPLNDRWLDRLSVVLKCSATDLLGEFVPVVGRIGAGGSVIFEDMGHDESVRRPPDTPGDLIGLEVVGESMLPKFDPGDVVYISRANDGVDDEDLGSICACRLTSGETYLKQLLKGSRKGSFTLRSYNAADMEDVELAWATPVRAITPARARRFH